jgi:hypothetical protein
MRLPNHRSPVPWSQKTHNFMSACQNPKSRKKMRGKCPSVATARKMMKEGVKKK